MKVVVVCVECFRSQAGLCWRVHGYSTQLHWQHSLQRTRQKWTDLSHHAQLSMCTSRDKMAATGMEFIVLIECEFVAVVSWKVGWLCFFLHKICTRPIGWLVSQFYSSLGCFYPSGTTGQVVSSNTGEMALLCNNVSHWLGANLESALLFDYHNSNYHYLIQGWITKWKCSFAGLLAWNHLLFRLHNVPNIEWHILQVTDNLSRSSSILQDRNDKWFS